MTHPFFFWWILLLERNSSVWLHLTIPSGILDYLIYNTWKCRSQLFNILALSWIRHQLLWRVCIQLSIILAILYAGGFSPQASVHIGYRQLVALNCRGIRSKNVIGYLYGWRDVWWRLKWYSCNVTWIWHMCCDCGFKIYHCFPWSSADLTRLYSLSISCLTRSSDSTLKIHHMASANQDKL